MAPAEMRSVDLGAEVEIREVVAFREQVARRYLSLADQVSEFVDVPVALVLRRGRFHSFVSLP